MSRESSIEYHSTERRNAIRVTPVGHKIQFEHSSTVYPCRDISVLGVGLETDASLPFTIGEIVAFVLNQDDYVIGQVRARLVHKKSSHSGWQFTALEDSVKEFVDNLVLTTQKDQLKKVAKERRAAQEKAFLKQDDSSDDAH